MLREYTQEDIDGLNRKENYCLVIIYGFVYNLCLFDHPGGQNLLLHQAGTVLDWLFENADYNHQFTRAQLESPNMLGRYRVGFFKSSVGSADSPQQVKQQEPS